MPILELDWSKEAFDFVTGLLGLLKIAFSVSFAFDYSLFIARLRV